MSAGVLLTTIRSLASSPSSTSRGQPPGALPRRQPRWSEFLWASCVTTPPVASRFLLPWLSLGETGESYVSSSLRLYTHPLLRHSSILPAVKASGGLGE